MCPVTREVTAALSLPQASGVAAAHHVWDSPEEPRMDHPAPLCQPCLISLACLSHQCREKMDEALPALLKAPEKCFPSRGKHEMPSCISQTPSMLHHPPGQERLGPFADHTWSTNIRDSLGSGGALQPAFMGLLVMESRTAMQRGIVHCPADWQLQRLISYLL